MRRATILLALAALPLVATGAATAGQVNGKHSFETAPPPCTLEAEALLSPRARREELALIRVRLLLLREEELARLRSRLEAQLRARENDVPTGEGNRALNVR